MFCVVRHPDIETLGVIPEGALAYQRLRGWFRVSEYRAEPAEFHLPDFEDSLVDLDAPTKKTKATTEESKA